MISFIFSSSSQNCNVQRSVGQEKITLFGECLEKSPKDNSYNTIIILRAGRRGTQGQRERGERRRKRERERQTERERRRERR
jgi:hypothetical protein